MIPPTLAESSSDFVLDKINEIRQYVEVTCDFEDQLKAILGQLIGAKSSYKRSKELKRLSWAINYEGR